MNPCFSTLASAFGRRPAKSARGSSRGPDHHLATKRALYCRAAGFVLFIISICARSPELSGQTTLAWDSNGPGAPLGGDGVWSTGAANWTADHGATYQSWPAPVTNPSGSNFGLYGPAAVFDGTAGTVTLGSAITASDLTFNSTGYIVNGASQALTLNYESSGFSPNVFVSGPATSATINATLAGNSGLTLNAGGTLALGGTNTLTGGIYVLNSALKVMSATGSLDSSNSLTFGASRDTSTTGGGGAFTLDNTNAVGATSQTLSTLSLYSGDATVKTNRVASQNVALTFSGQSRLAGATVNYVVSGGVNGTENKINLSSPASGYLDQGSFFTGAGYAWKDSGGFLRAINYGSDSGAVTTAGATSITGTHVQLTGNVTAQNTATFSTLKLTGTSSLTLAGSQTLTVNGILKTGGGSDTISGGTAVHASSGGELVIRTDTSSDSLAISSTITANGTNALTKSGAGTLTLSGTNTYKGGTYLNAGTLSVASLPASTGNSTLGTSTVNFSGGTLQYTGGSASTSRKFAGLGGGGGIEVTQSGTTLTITSQFKGANTGLTSDAVVKTGAGTLVLGGSSDNSGLILAVNAGTAQLAKSSADFTSAVSSLIVNNGGTARLAGSGGNQIYDGGGVTLNTGGVLDLNGQSEGFEGLYGGGSLTNSTTTSTTLTLGTNNDPTTRATFSGVISDGSGSQTMAVYKMGAGTQILSGTNTYTGGTVIGGNGGTLQIGDGGTTGSVAGDIANDAALVFNRSDRLTYAGVISGGGTVAQNGTGTLVFTGSNTYTGGTAIKTGTLQFTTPHAMSATGTVTVANGATLAVNAGGSGEFTAATTNTAGSIGGLLGGQGGQGAAVSFAAGAALGIDTTNATGGSLTYAGAIANTNGGANALGLTKLGAGTLKLTANNTFTGTTTISGGTLEIAATGSDAALGGTTAITLKSSGTLLTSSANQINANARISLAGGALNTGDTTQGLGALTLSASSLLNLGGGNTGNLTFANSSSQSWTSTAFLSILNYDGKTFNLNSGMPGGTPGDAIFFGSDASGLTLAQIAQIQFVNPAGYTGTFGAYLDGNGELLVAVPEPATWPAGVLAALLGVSAWRRRVRA